MNKLLLIAIVAFFAYGCGNSKPDQVEITIALNHGEGITCETYLAKYYEVVFFDSSQRKVVKENVDCYEGISEISVFIEKGNYYFTVSLKDNGGSIKSYGSGSADASETDITVSVKMDEYKGGISFSWNSDDCENYDISLFKFTLLENGNTVNAVIWGKDTEISNYEISCKAEFFEVVNIEPGKYSAKADAFRLEGSETPRITYNIPEFIMVSGQTTTVKMNDSKEIVVSDLFLLWEFDSKSISTCSDAGIVSVTASLISDENTFSFTNDCDDKFSSFKFFDIPEGDYEILLRGMDTSDNTLFESSETIEIKKGSIGKDALSETIYLKKNND